MNTVADKLGWGPKRSIEHLSDNQWKITVTPPKMFGFNCSSEVILNNVQYVQYAKWLQGQGYIQDIEGLTPAQREMLLSGITPEVWDEKFKDDEEDE